MKTWKATVLNNTKLLLGEGAIWSSLWNKFLYVDIEGKKVGIVDPIYKTIEERYLGENVGTVVPTQDGRLIVGLETTIKVFDFDTEELNELVKIETDTLSNRSNDGKCDAAGRLWIGTMNKNAKGAAGALYCFDGKRIKKKIANTKVSNGICWSSDAKTMYYIDSFDYNIKSYDFDLISGDISNENIVVEVPQKDGMPDGMAIDQEGMLWVAMWGGSCVNRYNPFSGELVGKVELDAPHVTSCAFGGLDMKQLLITTAIVGLNEEQLIEFPNSGSLFLVDVGIKGMEMNQFKI